MTQIRQIYTDFKELRQHAFVILSKAKNFPNAQGDASRRSA